MMRLAVILLTTFATIALAQPPQVPCCWYPATYVSAYDGDTVTLQLHLGLDITATRTIRLHGLDTPEVRGDERPDGLRVRDHVRNLLTTADTITIHTPGDATGKYGRLLAVIWLDGTLNLNAHLITTGRAAPYDGGAR